MIMRNFKGRWAIQGQVGGSTRLVPQWTQQLRTVATSAWQRAYSSASYSARVRATPSYSASTSALRCCSMFALPTSLMSHQGCLPMKGLAEGRVLGDVGFRAPGRRATSRRATVDGSQTAAGWPDRSAGDKPSRMATSSSVRSMRTCDSCCTIMTCCDNVRTLRSASPCKRYSVRSERVREACPPQTIHRTCNHALRQSGTVNEMLE
jgi:hypothetical protein